MAEDAGFTPVDTSGFTPVAPAVSDGFERTSPTDGRPSPFDFFGNLVAAATKGVEDIKYGLSPERSQERAKAIQQGDVSGFLPSTAPLTAAKGAFELVTSPITAASRAFGGAIEKATGGIIPADQAEIALMGIAARGGMVRLPKAGAEPPVAAEPIAAETVPSAPAESPPPPAEAVAQDIQARGVRAVTSSPELETLRVEASQPPGQVDALQAKAPGLTEPITKETFSRDVNGAVLDLLEASKVRLAPGIKVSDQVRDLLQTNLLQPETFNAILEKHGVSPVKFLEEVTQGDVGRAMRESATTAGRTLQQLSELRKAEMRIRALSGEQSAEVTDFLRGQDNNVGNGIVSFIQRVGNIWRGSLVSQVSTAVRNAETQLGRAGMDVLERGMEQGLRTIFGNPMRKILGKEPITDPIDSLGSLVMTLNPKRAKLLTDAIADVHPSVRESLFARYSSDVNRATGGAGILGKWERGIDLLNWGNRTQEYFFRRAFFAESLGRRLKGKGMNLDEIVQSNRIGAIPEDAIKGAVTDALEKTFARPLPPRGTIAGDILGGLSKIPFSPVPFVRFMTEAMRFQYEYSPLGAVRILHPTELKALASGETKQMQIAAKALAGSTLLYAAYQARTSEHAGPAWYELKIGNKTVDMRPYAPFSVYLFVADLIKRMQDGTLLGMNAKDLAQGLVGVNFKAGAGLYIVDQLFNDLAGVDSSKKMLDIVKSYAGNILSGFATPFQMLKDGIGQFVPSERQVKDTSQSPLTGPTRQRIPFAAQDLPPAVSPTRAGGFERDQPLIRQLTGVTFRTGSNPAEEELTRLGFHRKDVLPSHGDKIFDTLVAKHMGPLFEQIMVPIVQSPGYKAIESNKVKSLLISEGALPAIREAAIAAARQEDAKANLRVQYNALSKRERAVIEEALTKKGTPLKLPE